jgi:hypothetical protein
MSGRYVLYEHLPMDTICVRLPSAPPKGTLIAARVGFRILLSSLKLHQDLFLMWLGNQDWQDVPSKFHLPYLS